MPLSATLLPAIGLWARGSGLEIVLLLTGAILLTRFATSLGGRMTGRIEGSPRRAGALVRAEAARHRRGLAAGLTCVALGISSCAGGVVCARGAAAADVTRVSVLLRLIGDEAYKELELRSLLLDPPVVMGVQSIDVDHCQVRLVARTLPGKQFDVGRMLRVRIAAGLRREGIILPAVLETAEPAGTG